jgi:hypothetical protein
MAPSEPARKSQTTKFLVISFALIFSLIGLYGAFVEYRGTYHTDGKDYELCDYNLIRNCTLLEVDSALYVATAQEFSFEKLYDTLQSQSIISLGSLNSILLYIDFNIAKSLAPDFPYVIVVFINALLYLGGALNVRAIARKRGIDERDALIVYFLNPLLLFAMTSLNKEIFGIYVVTAMARAYLNRHLVTLLFLLILAFLTRFAFGALGLILLARYLMPWFKAKHVLLFLGLAIPAVFRALEGQLGGSNAPSLYEFAASIEQRSAAVMTFAARAMDYPFGPFLGWILIGAVNVLSPVSNFGLYGRYADGFNIDIFAQQSSSFLFALFGAITLWNIARRKFVLLPVTEIFLYFMIIVSTFPISAHRYLTAGWPLLALGALEYGALLAPVAGAAAVGHRAVKA